MVVAPRVLKFPHRHREFRYHLQRFSSGSVHCHRLVILLVTTSNPGCPSDNPPPPGLNTLALLSFLELLFLPSGILPILNPNPLLLTLPALPPSLASCRFSAKAAGKRPHFPLLVWPDQHSLLARPARLCYSLRRQRARSHRRPRHGSRPVNWGLERVWDGNESFRKM